MIYSQYVLCVQVDIKISTVLTRDITIAIEVWAFQHLRVAQ
jgi:hypothetical protein